MSVENPRAVDDRAGLVPQKDLRPDREPSRVKKNKLGRIPAENDPSLTKELILRLVELIKQV
jgi:hypothetical protein